ncbi:MAG: M23 family metallopeptidase [Bacteroidales bacterium]|jgi:murein DD-endopeptidase MepM/ murein hydrolase activator NlpD|nr:M23 family metallopeptidase [Bacteroidales bacterium]
MSNKKYILFVENGSEMREMHFNWRHFISILVVIFVLLSISVFGLSKMFSKFNYQKKIAMAYKENDNLGLSINLMQEKVSELNKTINDIVEKDKAIRLYSNLPENDININELGTGGRVNRKLYIDNDNSKRSTQLTNIDESLTQISKEIQSELISYENLTEILKEKKQKLDATPTIAPLKDNAYISSPYGKRIDPFTGRISMHDGIDFAARMGTPIYATADGKVKYARYIGGYGYTIKINHDFGYSTIFGHMSKMKAKKGQNVKRGDLIGYIGNTGRSTGPHLHYEIRYNKRPVNPSKYMWIRKKL